MKKLALIRKSKVFLIWYGLTLIAFALLILMLLAFNESVSRNRFWELFWRSIQSISSGVTVYLVSLIPYVFYQLIKSFIRDFKKKNWTGLARGITLKTITPIIFIWGSIRLMDEYRFGENFEYTWDHSVENKTDRIRDNYLVDGKQRGMHVMNLSSDTTDLEMLKTNNVEWITLVPFMSQQDYNTPSLMRNRGRRDSLRSINRWRNTIELCDRYGFKVMIKPHIWLNNRPGNVWRSSIEMTSEEDWKKWFDQYTEYVLTYARLSEALGVEQFCVGTELNASVMAKPEMWLALIKKVRAVYSGQLTYAANWDDDLQNIQLWEALDFIGIQAYFPITKHSGPDLEELEAGWESHYSKLESFNSSLNKPILFTEIGYKSTRNAGKEPWEWNTFNHRFYRRISHKTQALCYEAFFNTVWQQPWFAGAHIWEWQSRGTSDGDNNSFTLEGKPGLNVVARGYR